MVHALARSGGPAVSGLVGPGTGRSPRVAFVAPRACGPAVRRNRTRRRVQEALRALMRAGVVGDDDLVVRFLPASTDAGSEELAMWLTSALRTLTGRR